MKVEKWKRGEWQKYGLPFTDELRTGFDKAVDFCSQTVYNQNLLLWGEQKSEMRAGVKYLLTLSEYCGKIKEVE